MTAFETACMIVNRCMENVNKYTEEYDLARKKMDDARIELDKAIRLRDSLNSNNSVQRVSVHLTRNDKDNVFDTLRKFNGAWLNAKVIASMANVPEERVAVILKKGKGVIPNLEHNGKRGRGSAYAWNPTGVKNDS